MQRLTTEFEIYRAEVDDLEIELLKIATENPLPSSNNFHYMKTIVGRLESLDISAKDVYVNLAKKITHIPDEEKKAKDLQDNKSNWDKFQRRTFPLIVQGK